MVRLPVTCSYCKATRMHYGACDCPDAQLDAIDGERQTIRTRLAEIEERERELVKKKLIALGCLTIDETHPG